MIALDWRDELEILDLLARVAMALDARDHESLGVCIDPTLSADSDLRSVLTPVDPADGPTFHVLHQTFPVHGTDDTITLSTDATTLAVRRDEHDRTVLHTLWGRHLDTVVRDTTGTWRLVHRARDHEWQREDVVDIAPSGSRGPGPAVAPRTSSSVWEYRADRGVAQDQIRHTLASCARAVDRRDAALFAQCVADGVSVWQPPAADPDLPVLHALHQTAMTFPTLQNAVSVTPCTRSWRFADDAGRLHDHIEHLWFHDDLHRDANGSSWLLARREERLAWSYDRPVDLQRPAPTDAYAVAVPGPQDPSYTVLELNGPAAD